MPSRCSIPVSRVGRRVGRARCGRTGLDNPPHPVPLSPSPRAFAVDASFPSGEFGPKPAFFPSPQPPLLSLSLYLHLLSLAPSTHTRRSRRTFIFSFIAINLRNSAESHPCGRPFGKKLSHLRALTLPNVAAGRSDYIYIYLSS